MSMTLPKRRSTPPGEAGFALIEVLVSAVIIVIVSGATFGLLSASAHSAAEERHRSEAFAIAQEDQARLRSLPVPTLNHLSQTRTVTLNGTPFTIESEGVFINDKTGTSSCGQGTSSADYVQVTSTVTWPSLGSRKPAEIQSIVAPPPGSLNPDHGTLTISADNAHELPIEGIGLSGTGAGTFSGTTDSNGCALFPDEPAGNYTLTPSGVASGLIEQNGNPPGPLTVSVIAGSTSTVQLLYDQPGWIPINFTTMSGGKLVSSAADSAVVFNTGMTTAKTFGTVGTPVTEIQAKPLFPFTSPDTVYAGSCEGDNPNPNNETSPPGAAAMASVIVPPGGSATTATIQLPVLNLNVWSGSSSSSPGSRVKSAHVIVSDSNCPAKRTYTTESSGLTTSLALPWSTYEVCADNGSGFGSHKQTISQAVQDLTSTGTTLSFYLGAGGLAKGPCT
jgi:Tfp pilus assembly protein PilV